MDTHHRTDCTRGRRCAGDSRAGRRGADPWRPAAPDGGDRGAAQRARNRPRRPGRDRAAERPGDGDRLRLGRRRRDHRAAQPRLSRGGVRLLPHRPRRQGADRRRRRGRAVGRRSPSAAASPCSGSSPIRTGRRDGSRWRRGHRCGRRGRAWRRPDDVALLLHTSGTTSRPKLVPLTHANLAASAAHIGASSRSRPTTAASTSCRSSTSTA